MHYDPQMLRTSLSNAQIENLPESFALEHSLSMLRDVVARCWITTPKDKQTFSEVASRVSSLVQEALDQLEEDLAETKDR